MLLLCVCVTAVVGLCVCVCVCVCLCVSDGVPWQDAYLYGTMRLNLCVCVCVCVQCVIRRVMLLVREDQADEIKKHFARKQELCACVSLCVCM